MTWGRFIVGSAEHDLSHLDPFTLRVTPKADGASTYKVLVSFSHHTFTRDWRDSDPAHLEYTARGDRRCFCTTRHGHSQNLPGIVTAAASGRAYFSQNRNYLLVENLPGLAGPYAVFFNMEPARLKVVDATMFVVSAYEKPGLPPKNKLPAITFATLVAKTVRGEAISRPKK